MCAAPIDSEDVYPIFIDHDERSEGIIDLPERPLPVRKPKIANPALLGTNQQLNKNNIVRGQPLAGSVFLAPLAVNSFVLDT